MHDDLDDLLDVALETATAAGATATAWRARLLDLTVEHKTGPGDLVSEADRGSRFERAVAVPPWASPGDRLVAALGREPWRRTTSEAV